MVNFKEILVVILINIIMIYGHLIFLPAFKGWGWHGNYRSAVNLSCRLFPVSLDHGWSENLDLLRTSRDWGVNPRRDWLRMLSFSHQRHQANSPLPQEELLRRWRQVLSCLHWEVPRSGNAEGSLWQVSTGALLGQMFCSVGAYLWSLQHNCLLTVLLLEICNIQTSKCEVCSQENI